MVVRALARCQKREAPLDHRTKFRDNPIAFADYAPCLLAAAG